ncbi:MAG: hypothetical protein QM750_11810 [Rubrivivax sp.]
MSARGRQMTDQTLSPMATACGARPAPKPTVRAPAPPELADVAMIDAPRIVAAACLSLSTWHELVRAGKAPQPAMRLPRCTRWRLADVRAWLIERAAQPVSDNAVIERATKASAKAQAARRARAAANLVKA